MTMNTSLLSSYINVLLEPELRSVHTIRIGTKALSYWPYRFTSDTDSDELIKLFERIVKSGKNLYSSSFTHPAVRKAIKNPIHRSTDSHTTPLLKHINDHPKIWAEMGACDLGCIPYYMFVARDTGSKRYFELPLAKC